MNEDAIVNMCLFRLSIHATLPHHYLILIAVIRPLLATHLSSLTIATRAITCIFHC